MRQDIQESEESIAALAARYGINHKTVLYWKHAGRIEDKKSGPTHPRSTVLTEAEEQIICEFRRVTKFSLDDVFVALKDKIHPFDAVCEAEGIRHKLTKFKHPWTI